MFSTAAVLNKFHSNFFMLLLLVGSVVGALGWFRLLQAEKEIASLDKQLMLSSLEKSQQYREMSKLQFSYEQFFQVSLSKTIQGTTYALESENRESEAVLRLSQNDTSTDSAVKNLIASFSYCCNKPTDFWYNPTQKELFLLIESWATGHDKQYSVRKLTIQDPGNSMNPAKSSVTSVQEFELKTLQAGQLRGARFYGYNEDSNSMLLIDQYGDGCGGAGSIWMWRENQQPKHVIDWTFGCTTQTSIVRRFAGSYQDKLILADFLPDGNADLAESNTSGTITNVYLLDPYTGSKENVALPIPDFATFSFSDLLSSYEREGLILNATITSSEIVISVAKDGQSQKERFALDLSTQQLRHL